MVQFMFAGLHLQGKALTEGSDRKPPESRTDHGSPDLQGCWVSLKKRRRTENVSVFRAAAVSGRSHQLPNEAWENFAGG